MKKKADISIIIKMPTVMGELKELKSECLTCISEITDRAEQMFNELQGNMKQDFKNLQESMKSDFKTTLAHFRDEVSQSLADINTSKELLKKEIKEENKGSQSLIKWMLSITLAITLVGLTGVAYNAGQIAGKADAKEIQLELKKYMTTESAMKIHSIRDAYYKDIFVHNPKAKVDSTNYNWLIKVLFEQNSRGGEQK